MNHRTEGKPVTTSQYSCSLRTETVRTSGVDVIPLALVAVNGSNKQTLSRRVRGRTPRFGRSYREFPHT